MSSAHRMLAIAVGPPDVTMIELPRLTAQALVDEYQRLLAANVRVTPPLDHLPTLTRLIAECMDGCSCESGSCALCQEEL